MQHLPSPLSYDWERSGDAYVSVMTDELPAPNVVIELSICSCKTKCITNRCKCNRYNLQGTDMCKCIGCENDGTDEQSDEELEYCSDDDEEESYF